MEFSRRDFIKTSAIAVGTAAALPTWAMNAEANHSTNRRQLLGIQSKIRATRSARFRSLDIPTHSARVTRSPSLNRVGRDSG